MQNKQGGASELLNFFVSVWFLFFLFLSLSSSLSTHSHSLHHAYSSKLYGFVFCRKVWGGGGHKTQRGVN